MMRSIAVGLPLVILVGAPSIGSACSCTCGPPFWEWAKDAKAVVIAEVTRHVGYDRTYGVPESFVLRVREVVRGSEARKEIRFKGGIPGTCNISALKFPVGTLWALLLERDQSQGNREEDQYLVWCCETWLALTSPKQPSSDEDAMSVETFRKTIRKR